MKRRTFITLLGSAAAWPLAARAQQSERVRRLGVLMGIENDAEGQTRVVALREGLRELGWVEGRNIRVDYRWTAGQPDLINKYAAELISLKPDLIMSATFASAAALRKQTHDIPVVFVMVSDPVGTGIVESIARPGGNITGFTPFEPSLGGKWIELLKEMSAGLARVTILFNPDTAPNAWSFVPPALSAAAALSVSATSVLARTDAEIEGNVLELASQPGGGLMIMPDAFMAARYKMIVAAVTRHRVPLIAGIVPLDVEIGGAALLALSR